jgi:drug/metabolite transporter (DMT)-like permease
VLAALTLGWGFNWPMMKLALAEVPLWTLRGLSVAAGAAGMFAIAAATGQRILPARAEWPRLAITALFNVTLWNLLVAFGSPTCRRDAASSCLHHAAVGGAALTLVLGEPLTARRMLGLSLGMLGMALLIGNELALLRAAVGALFESAQRWHGR